MANNIDPYSIVTNGIIATNQNIFILDPLGYYVLVVEEEVIPEEELPSYVSFGGGGIGRKYPSKYAKGKEYKRVKLHVKFNSIDKKDFHEEFYLDDINLTIKNAKLVDNEIELTIFNPKLNESIKKSIKFEISDVKLDKKDISVKTKI